jgi:hypothetical protein
VKKHFSLTAGSDDHSAEIKQRIFTGCSRRRFDSPPLRASGNAIHWQFLGGGGIFFLIPP